MELAKQVKLLQEALTWYADPRHYQLKLGVYPSDVEVDGGTVANQALEHMTRESDNDE
jgi:hypothetical protein